MKNLSVGRKIATSFGVVLTCVILILVSNMITSARRNAALAQVDLLSELQNEANSALDSFNSARYAAINGLVINNVEQYNNADTHIQAAISSIGKARTYADQLEGDYATAFLAAEGMLKQYQTDLNTVKSTGEAASEETLASMDQQATAILSGIDSAVVVVTNDEDLQLSSIQLESDMAMLIMMGLSLVTILIAIGMAIYLMRSITRPLGVMRAAIDKVGQTGSLEFSEEAKKNIRALGTGKDELAQSIGAFAKMMDHLTYMGVVVGKVADGDLSESVQPLSPEDTLGVALKTMNDNLNNVIGEIRNAADQVAVGASQIATGAQTLATGNTEQASTVQEIGSSVAMINEQAENSSHTAQSAAKDGDGIRDIALEGNAKMREMMSAMQDISDASQSIEQVIKTIEDIAFQTNLLALNAAVEAAHAGQQGAGFAVVASEVKALATRSTSATKETSELITANIEKTRLGLAVCQDTAQSLERIVDGIQRTSQSLEEMANQAESSMTATSQVNVAMYQVAEVVQANSATAEESAASAEELSAQSALLQKIVSQFKLKEEGGARLSASTPATDRLPYRADTAVASPYSDDILHY